MICDIRLSLKGKMWFPSPTLIDQNGQAINWGRLAPTNTGHST